MESIPLSQLNDSRLTTIQLRWNLILIWQLKYCNNSINYTKGRSSTEFLSSPCPFFLRALYQKYHQTKILISFAILYGKFIFFASMYVFHQNRFFYSLSNIYNLLGYHSCKHLSERRGNFLCSIKQLK